MTQPVEKLLVELTRAHELDDSRNLFEEGGETKTRNNG
jgi:hypothetical protein